MGKYLYSLGLLFCDVAERFRDRPALRFSNGSEMNYGELNSLSNRLAAYLKEKGVKTGNVVGLFHDKSALGYGSMLACLKIGAIYVNLDPTSPVERLRKIIKVCQPSIILSGEDRLESERDVFGVEVSCYNGSEFFKKLEDKKDRSPDEMAQVDGGAPAYLMFTSGSTGFPKGAVIQHSSVINFINWSQTTCAVTPDDVFTNINPMYFDNSVFDFYSALFTGACLIPITEKLAKIPRRLIEEIDRLKCTIWFSVPSMFVYVLRMRALLENDMPEMRLILFGGEGFPKTALRQLYSLVGDRIKLFNVYGPTECTCTCASYPVCEEDLESPGLLPLGPIAPNFSFCILDNNYSVEDGKVGELCLKGPQVGAGYYNNREQTEKAFVPDPLFHEYGRLMYRTGDLVHYDPEANLLWFSGRKDNQVKRMGYRIELEEIEAALGALSYVNEAACVFIRPEADDPGRIIAWVSGESDEKTIMVDLREILPHYMLPNHVRVFPELPKNQNGKIDRKAVHEMETERMKP